MKTIENKFHINKDIYNNRFLILSIFEVVIL